jgi:hypothetical protein
MLTAVFSETLDNIRRRSSLYQNKPRVRSQAEAPLEVAIELEIWQAI